MKHDNKRPADGNEDANKYDQETYDETGAQAKQPSKDHKRPADQKNSGNAGKHGTKTYKENEEFSLSDELGSLLEDEGFTDDFKDKAKTVFEAAVNDAIKSHIAKLDEQYEQDVETARNEIKEQLEEDADKYLTYAVNEWKKDNELAIERGVRTEITESLMENLMKVFEEHHIAIPEGKEDAYEAAVERSENLAEQLNEKVEKIVSMENKMRDLEKQNVIESYTRNMTDIDAEKVKSLAESVEFEDRDGFVSKLDALHESFVSSNSGGGDSKDSDALTEDYSGPAEEEKTVNPNDPIAIYAKHLRVNK